MELNSVEDVQQAFPDEMSVRKHWVEIRWGKWAHCPYCGNEKCYFIENGVRYKCANNKCYRRFHVTVKTIFEASNIPLDKWMQIWFFYCKRRGKCSTSDLVNELKITAKTGFWVLNKLDFIWPQIDRTGKSTFEIINELIKLSGVLYDSYSKIKESQYFKNPFHVSSIDNISDVKQYNQLLHYTKYYIDVYADWIFFDFATAQDVLSEVFLYMHENGIKEYNTELILHLIWKVTDRMWRKCLNEHPKFNSHIKKKSKERKENNRINISSSYLVERIKSRKMYSHLTTQEIRENKNLMESVKKEILELRKTKGRNYEFNSHFS